MNLEYFNQLIINNPKTTSSFRNDFYYLSNMFLSEFKCKYGDEYDSSESFYLVNHFKRHSVAWSEIYRESLRPDFEFQIKAKHLKSTRKALSIEFPNDVNINIYDKSEEMSGKRIKVMKHGLLYKFTANQKIRKNLLETGDKKIEEVNVWHDHFWGISPEGYGRNELGKCLMGLRKYLRESSLANG